MSLRSRDHVEPRYHFKRFNGPLGIAATCDLCSFSDFVKKAPAGRAGRGWGMREGNKQRGRMIQHFNAAHKAAMDTPTQTEQPEGE